MLYLQLNKLGKKCKAEFQVGQNIASFSTNVANYSKVKFIVKNILFVPRQNTLWQIIYFIVVYQEVVIYWWSGGGPGLSTARLTSSLSTTSPNLITPTLKEK